MVDEIVVGFEDPRVLKAGEPEARLWSSLPNREPVAHQNPGAMVSEPTRRASWVRHVESDSPPSGNRPRVTISGTRYKMMAGVNLVHVPYRGSAPALTDMISGQVQVMFDVLTSSLQHIRSGALRALAVTTATRSKAPPDLPTVGDFLPGYEASAWYGVAAPKSTPSEIVDKLNMEINAGLVDSKLRPRLADLGGTVIPGSPADFGKLVAEEIEKWGKVVRFSGAKPE